MLLHWKGCFNVSPRSSFLCTYQCNVKPQGGGGGGSYALINVKPQGGGGGATHGKLRVGNLTWPPSWKTERNWRWVTYQVTRGKWPLLFFKVSRQHERKKGKEICFIFRYMWTITSFTVWSKKMFINRRVFVLLRLLFVHVCILMNVLRDAWLHCIQKLIITHVFFALC